MAVTVEPGLDRVALAGIVQRALAEDVGAGDLTTNAIVPVDQRWRARLLLEQPGVVAGVPVAEAVFRALDSEVQLRALVAEGTFLQEVPSAVAELLPRLWSEVPEPHPFRLAADEARLVPPLGRRARFAEERVHENHQRQNDHQPLKPWRLAPPPDRNRWHFEA